MYSRRKKFTAFSSEGFRFFALIALFTGLFLLVLWKLFQFQVIQGEELSQRAQEMRNASVSISARRGGIFLQDTKINDTAPVALNTTLYTVFFDARAEFSHIEEFPEVAAFLTETLYTREKFAECQEDINKCPEGSVIQVIGIDEDDIVLEKAPTYTQAKQAFQNNLIKIFSEKRKQIIWAVNVDNEILQRIESASLPSLYVSFEKQQVYINLEGLTDSNRSAIAKLLSQEFGGNEKRIAEKLYSKRRGYIPVMSRVYPHELEIITQKKKEKEELYSASLIRAQQLQKAGEVGEIPKKSSFLSIGFEEAPVRYYPEGQLAAQVIGFVNAEKEGQYGIERSLNRLLKGEDGIISTSRDVRGNSIGIDEQDSLTVKDGANIILTIDRSLQKTIEKILAEKVEEYQADSAQAVLIDPSTGKIIAMAEAPSFDPNFFGNVYERKKVEEDDLESIYKTTPLEQKDENNQFVAADFETWEKAKNRGAFDEYYMFKNNAGPKVYVNKTVMEIYEPGSVIKPLVVAAALEEGEVTPYTRYNEKEPREVGQFTIRNSDGEYLARQTIGDIVDRSANVGMSLIADDLGPALMYEALKNFGFGEYTNILLPEELSGEVKYYKQWSDARLYTASYGQGFSATPLQVVRAWTALANDGYIVEPRIVDRVEYIDGEVEEIDISKRRIFSHQTIEEMRGILISAVENGVAKNARVRNHYIAGKTGTSQIINPKTGKYESIEGDEKGTTITSFIGFAPVDDPKYLLYVKFDRPRKGMRDLAVFGSTTAAPTFAEIMNEVFQYYNVPKDK